MNFNTAFASCSNVAKRLLGNTYNSMFVSKNFASGRWYPQPAFYSTHVTDHAVIPTGNDVTVSPESAAPVYYKPKGEGKKAYGLVAWKNGEQLANYALFEDSINRSTIPWNNYEGLTSAERDIYMKHLKAVEQRRLSYPDPTTGYLVFTISHHLEKGKCCGNGCRHCPYELINANEEVKRSKVWNGMNYQNTEPGHPQWVFIAEQDVMLWTTLPLERKLTVQILVAVRGEMRKAFVVGANTHVHYRKHGVPVTDTNNIVLLDEEGNPLGNRIMAPIPTTLLKKRDNVQFAKILALANKYV